MKSYNYKIEKNKLKQFLDSLQKKYTLFAPVESDGMTSFKEITRNSQLSTLNSHNTDKPPKEIFFPQTETLFTYDKNSQLATRRQESAPTPIALFGVRPCDVKSFLLLNKVFDSEKYTDTYWKERYKDVLVCTLGCNNPLSTCFCNWFGGGPFNKEGTDIFLTDIGDSFLIEPCSEKGVRAVRELSLQKATENDLKKGEDIKNEAESMLSKPVVGVHNYTPLQLKEKLDSLWDSPIWEEIAYKCLNCAACTYLCPTCHCFDIQDEGKGNKGERIRIWDSCMFKLFTQEAAGTNPRPTGKERMRQRIMHKFNYFVENIGEFGCVGCGRCIRSCPVNVDIRSVLQCFSAPVKEQENGRTGTQEH